MAIEYSEPAGALLPRGKIWSQRPESTLRRIIGALTVEFSAVDARAKELLDELDPRTTVQLLEEHERIHGLPDKCTLGTLTFQERRDRLVTKVVQQPRLTIVYLQQLAEMLGYPDVTVQAFVPSRCGVARCGLPLSGPNARFYFRAIVPNAKVTYFRCGESEIGDRLGDISTAGDLECVLREAKPAHMVLIFSYEGVTP